MLKQILKDRTDEDTRKIYSKLPTNSKIIRLLELLPAIEPSSSIECRLSEEPLGSRNAYKALSYAWKERDDVVQPTAEIFIATRHSRIETSQEEEVKIKVPRSLFQALRRLRLPELSLYLWVDSICINQQENDERTHQVGMMGDIYRHASEVIIWLGEGEPDDELGEWLQGVYQRTVNYVDWHDGNQSKGLVGIYLDGYDKLLKTNNAPLYVKNDVYGAFCLIWLLAQGKRPEEIPFYLEYNTQFSSPQQFKWSGQVAQGLRKIMERNWWRRSWVVQETVLARKATVVYSTISAPWTMFAKAALNHLQQKAMDDLDKVEFMRAWTGTQESRSIENNSNLSVKLLPLLRRFRSRNSSDDRDKVFSFLGLLDQKLEFPISVNYHCSREQVYRDAVINIIRETKSLDVLGGTLQQVDHSPFVSRLPTWVTDWSMPNPEYETERLSFFNGYNASNGLHAYSALHANTVLEIRGFVVAQVVHDFGTAPDYGIERLRATIRRWEDEWTHEAHFASPSPSAFWRTMCADTLYHSTGSLTSTGFRQGTFERAADFGEKAYQAWISDERAKRNRYTSIMGDIMANAYQEPVRMTRRKNAYHFAVQSSLVSRKFFAYQRTSRYQSALGETSPNPISMGTGPQTLQTGDYICVAMGSKVPFIIRLSGTYRCNSVRKTVLSSHEEPRDWRKSLLGRNKAEEPMVCPVTHATHSLIGDAYVHDLMDGEAVVSGLNPESIFLV